MSDERDAVLQMTCAPEIAAKVRAVADAEGISTAAWIRRAVFRALDAPSTTPAPGPRDPSRFESWCILELMGHRRRAGFVREAEIAGAKFLRIDIPGRDTPDAPAAPSVEYYAPSSVYAITPVTEARAREEALGREVPFYPQSARLAGWEPEPGEPEDEEEDEEIDAEELP